MSLKLMKEHTFPKNISIFLSYFTGHTFAQKIFSTYYIDNMDN